jgi:hypothetical protein
MTREQAYEVIDTEREYQEKIWSNLNKTINNPSSFILWMEEYLSMARSIASKRDETKGTEGCAAIMEMLRKVTALGVACIEINDAPKRLL